MVHGMPTLCARFDIDKVGSAYYAVACWKVFWQAVGPSGLKSAFLYQGYTAITRNRLEEVFCIGVQSADPSVLKTIRQSLSESKAFLRVCAYHMFAEAEGCDKEPLLSAGRVDERGVLLEAAAAVRSALEGTTGERQLPPGSAERQSPAVAPRGEALGSAGSVPQEKVMRLTCPQCKKPLGASQASMGKKVACPACGCKFLVSGPSPVPNETRRSLSAALYGALRYGKPNYLESAVATIEQVGSVADRLKLALQSLKQALKSMAPDSHKDAASAAAHVRRAAAHAMTTIGDPLCIDSLIECVSVPERNEEVYAVAANALAKSRIRRGVDPLCRALRYPSGSVQQVAADALRSYRDPLLDEQLSARDATLAQQAQREAEEARRKAEEARRRQQPGLEEARRLLAGIIALDPRERWDERIAHSGDKAIAELILHMVRNNYDSGVIAVGRYLKGNGGADRLADVAGMVSSLCHSDAHVLQNLFIYWHEQGRLM